MMHAADRMHHVACIMRDSNDIDPGQTMNRKFPAP